MALRDKTPFSVAFSSPGKLIFTGEHAVVYGNKAIASSINLRVKVSFHIDISNKDHQNEDCLEIHFKTFNQSSFTKTGSVEKISQLLSNLKNSYYSDASIEKPTMIQEAAKSFILEHISSTSPDTPFINEKNLQLALMCFLHVFMSCGDEQYFHDMQPNLCFSLKIDFGVPLGSGLGSSAALNTCYSAIAVHCFSQGQYVDHLPLINQLALMCEYIVHGKPSGIDNHVSLYGGVWEFDGTSKSRLTPLSNSLLIVDSKQTRNTKTLVEKVGKLKTQFPELFQCLLSSFQQVALDMKTLFTSQAAEFNGGAGEFKNDLFSLEADDYDSLKNLFNINHHLLCSLGVSTSSLNKIVMLSNSMNLAAKLTGAGGGGCAIVVLPPNSEPANVESLKCLLLNESFDIFPCELSSQGLKLEDE